MKLQHGSLVTVADGARMLLFRNEAAIVVIAAPQTLGDLRA